MLLPMPLLPLPPAGLAWLFSALANALLILPLRRVPVLTTAGWFHAWILGTLLGASLGWRGWLAVVLYLALGSAVTRLGLARKRAAGLAEKRDGRRGPENVWGSAATGALLALMTTLPGAPQGLLLTGFVASFAAKLGDTCGSEIGKRWGRRTVSLTRLRPVPAGTEGAVSLEGTVASLVGAAVFAGLAVALGLLPPSLVPALTLVAWLATLIESLIGAELQPRLAWLSNEAVNGLMTLLAALLAMGLLGPSLRP